MIKPLERFTVVTIEVRTAVVYAENAESAKDVEVIPEHCTTSATVYTSAYARPESPWGDRGQHIGTIPRECVEDCTTPGQPADESVAYWVRRLAWNPPRELAIAYLRSFGAWDDLDTVDDETIARRTLWCVCGDLRGAEDETPRADYESAGDAWQWIGGLGNV